MTEQRAEDRGDISPRTPLALGVHSGGVHVTWGESSPRSEGPVGATSRTCRS
jgi:hypothetical protein